MSTYIPFDLQVSIIERLPVKSLIRFKSVCKRWNSFINSSHFIAGYKIRSNHPHHLFIRSEIGNWEQNEVKYVSIVDDDTFPQKKSVPIVPPILKLLNRSSIGSSHGLLCFNGLFRESNNSITKMAVIWNPSIRKSIAVVVPNDNVLSSPFVNVVGFGVCPRTNDPKIVNIRYIIPLRSIDIESIDCIPKHVQVFTLSSGKWKTLCRNLPRKSIEFPRSQMVIGQFIYWLANDNDKKLRDDGFVDHNLIMSFDLSTEEFREVQVPNDLYNSSVTISKLRESLVLLDYSIINPIEVCGVWMMMDDGESKTFTKLFIIKGPGSSVLGFRKTGEPTFEMQDDNEDINEPYPLVVFFESCIDHIKDLAFPKCNSFSMSSYTESLLLLDHDDGHIVRCGAVKT